MITYYGADALPPAAVYRVALRESKDANEWRYSETAWHVVYEGMSLSLAELNDEYHLSFAELADLIEEQL